MSSVDENTLQEIREGLDKRRAELINKSHLTQSEIRSKDQMQGGRDSLDESTEEQDTSTRLRFADRDSNLLVKINDTIERIDDDDYGYCESCEEPINPKRLRARPTTTMCIDCKEDQERMEGHHKVRPGLIDEYE